MKHQILKAGLALIVILAAAGIYIIAAQAGKVEGLVYADSNANGRQDAGEEGIAEVAVSNGREVVLSDKQGRYRLPKGKSRTVFVIKPSGYRLPTDGLSKPRFYHHVDSAPAYDFGLIPEESPDEDFSILVFGDPQPYREQEVDYYDRKIISDVENPGQYRFGLTLGDIVNNKPELFQPVAEATARLGIPWWYVIGNHDLDYQASDPVAAREPYREFFGPTAYAFNEGRVHFIVLDSMAWVGPKGRNFSGGFDDPQLAFVEADLRHVPEDHLIVLAMHMPPLGEWAFQGKFRLDDRQRLFELLAGRPVLTLAAHTHSQWRMDFDSTLGWNESRPHHLYIAGTAGGDFWKGLPDETGLPEATMRDGTPQGYATIHFEGNRYRLDWKAAGRPADYRLRVHGPAGVPSSGGPEESAMRFFYVNYFMGYYRGKEVMTPIEYREPGGEWQPMVPSFEADPYRIGLEYPWLEAHWKGTPDPPRQAAEYRRSLIASMEGPDSH